MPSIIIRQTDAYNKDNSCEVLLHIFLNNLQLTQDNLDLCCHLCRFKLHLIKHRSLSAALSKGGKFILLCNEKAPVSSHVKTALDFQVYMKVKRVRMGRKSHTVVIHMQPQAMYPRKGNQTLQKQTVTGKTAVRSLIHRKNL